MIAKHAIAGIGMGVLVAAGLFTSPSLFAQESRNVAHVRPAQPVGTGIGSFTPATADPKLAAVLARNGLSATGFRFTPSEGRAPGTRAVTVAVRASTTRGAQANDRVGAVTAAAPTLAPIAYNLGLSVGWKRFAASGDLARLDLASQPGTREPIRMSSGDAGRRPSAARMATTTERAGVLADQPALLAEPGRSLDVGGSYSLTRNLDVTAGVRYRSEKDRLTRIDPDRRDSQAVYVGTAFRF